VPQWVIWIIAAAVFLLLVIVQVVVQAKKPVRKAIGGILTGIIALIAVNVSGIFTGVTLPVSLMTVGVSAVAGIPGVTMLLLMSLIMK
jgi:pro-sigmaK processing inhibitor BofA